MANACLLCFSVHMSFLVMPFFFLFRILRDTLLESLDLNFLLLENGFSGLVTLYTTQAIFAHIIDTKLFRKMLIESGKGQAELGCQLPSELRAKCFSSSLV